MTYIDKTDWHSGGQFPKDLDPDCGGTHIGMYITWIIENDLLEDELSKELEEEIKQLKNRAINGRDFLFDYFDGKFPREVLNEIGRLFTLDYYEYHEYEDAEINYINHYMTLLPFESDIDEDIYRMPNTWEIYDKLKPLIDETFSKWLQKRKSSE